MQVMVNGEWQEVAEGISIADLLGSMSLHPLRVAVELNKQLVPRVQHPQTVLTPEDQLEIVTLVGGG